MYNIIPSCPELVVSPGVFAHYGRERQCIDLLRNELVECSCHVVAPGSSADAPIFAETEPKHASSCALGNGFELRHRAACSGVTEVLRTVPGLFARCNFSESSQHESPDFDITNFSGPGSLAYLEYSVVDPKRACYINTTAGTASDCRDHEKSVKYRALGLLQNHAVHAISHETTGRLSRNFRKFLKICQSRHDKVAFELTAPRRTWACADWMRFHVQRLSIAFWCGSHQMHSSRASVNEHRRARAIV